MKKSLKKGSSYCKECDGTGRVELTFEQAYGISSGGSNLKNIVCTKCNGTGQFDWIEQVVGKKSKSIHLGFYPDDTAGYVSKELINEEIKKRGS